MALSEGRILRPGGPRGGSDGKGFVLGVVGFRFQQTNDTGSVAGTLLSWDTSIGDKIR